MTNHRPFVIFALPRSRTAWLARFLTYGETVCGHDELRHMRTLGDVEAWFTQPNIGMAETAGAPWWRLLGHYAPTARVVVVRRHLDEVHDSLMRIDGVRFDPDAILKILVRLDRKLDQIEARLSVLSVRFDDLQNEDICAAIFEHCLPYRHDHEHWARLDQTNVQADLRAMMRYMEAYMPAYGTLIRDAVCKTVRIMARKVSA